MLKKTLIAFDKALPVWIQGRENEMNLWLSLIFSPKEKAVSNAKVKALEAAFSVP